MHKFRFRDWALLALSLLLCVVRAPGDDKPEEKKDAPKEAPAGESEAAAKKDAPPKEEPKKKDEAGKEEGKQDEPKKDEAKKAAKKKPVKEADKEAKDGKAELPAEVLNAVKAAEEKATKAVEGAEKATDAAKKTLEAVEVKLDGAPVKPGEEKKSAEKKDAKPAQKKPPEPPMFRLRDGTRLAGTPEIKSLNVKTAYGRLTVPVVDVIRMRFATAEDTGLAGRVEAQVKALSSEEFDKREEAMAAIREIGVPALQALKKAIESDDEEVKSRAEKLVGEIEETIEEAEGEEAALGAVPGDEDEVVTLKFTVRGRVEEEKFALQTRYGALTLGRNDIVSVLFQEGPNTKVTFAVPGNTFAAANKWVDTKLPIAQGQRLHITASGQLNLENYGQTTGPEGTTNISGNQLETHPAGALVGKIGNGKAFLIGAEYEGAANAAGSLQLGVSLNNGQISGQYQVDVEKEGEG